MPHEAEPPSGRVPVAGSERPKADAQVIRVLVVEDDPTEMLMVRETLRREGFQMTCVERLSDAKRRLREERFDVALIDLGLPDSQGFATFTAMHDAAPDVAIIVLTILDNDELAIRAMREGAQDYIIKGELSSRHLWRPIRYALERKRMQDELAHLLEREQKARREAEEANRIKDHFLMRVSHELRTPLSAIIGWVEILRRSEPDPAQLARGLEVTARNAATLRRLVDDLIDLARIVSGKVCIEACLVDLGVVILAAMDTVRLAASTKGIQLSSSLDPAGVSVIGDADRLQQVVWNLLANAIKFTEPGGEVKVELSREGSHAKIRVRDTGMGLCVEDLERIFRPFQQKETPKGRAGGLGLGLAIVQHLVEMHGGAIHAMSDGLQQGATFEVTLPLAT